MEELQERIDVIESKIDAITDFINDYRISNLLSGNNVVDVIIQLQKNVSSLGVTMFIVMNIIVIITRIKMKIKMI